MPWAEIELDPATQTARYRMPDGTLVDPIEAGKHGRITPTYKPTGTHVDGGPGGGRKDSDTHTDGQPDQG